MTDPFNLVKDFESHIAELQQKSTDLQEKISSAPTTVSSGDGSVKVTVGANGGLLNLVLSDRAMENKAAKLTQTILELVRKAQHQVSGHLMEAFEPLGIGTESMAIFMDSMPDDKIEETEDPIEAAAAKKFLVEDDQPEPTAPKVKPQAPAPKSKPRHGATPAEDEDDFAQPW